jgi:hypothetical protein
MCKSWPCMESTTRGTVVRERAAQVCSDSPHFTTSGENGVAGTTWNRSSVKAFFFFFFSGASLTTMTTTIRHWLLPLLKSDESAALYDIGVVVLLASVSPPPTYYQCVSVVFRWCKWRCSYGLAWNGDQATACTTSRTVIHMIIPEGRQTRHVSTSREKASGSSVAASKR